MGPLVVSALKLGAVEPKRRLAVTQLALGSGEGGKEGQGRERRTRGNRAIEDRDTQATIMRIFFSAVTERSRCLVGKVKICPAKRVPRSAWGG